MAASDTSTYRIPILDGGREREGRNKGLRTRENATSHVYEQLWWYIWDDCDHLLQTVMR